MSNRFVQAGQIDSETLQKQIERENEESAKHAEEQRQREGTTLVQQLEKHKLEKYQEYQQQLEHTNSAYRLNEKDSMFYNELQRKQKDQEAVKARFLGQRVDEYRKLKDIGPKISATQHLEVSSLITSAKTKPTPKKRRIDNSSRANIVDYSSSDDDEDEKSP
ncbi:BA75_02266T0 [Komagataella pastoris]|uniref:BA75_02266T0 n=1 Tax=Komagataella pastoris TaxID=4922 RepID=A0A1B2JDM1_PICPA|nr:BA75_02266T0 [Komagataella pastoris]